MPVNPRAQLTVDPCAVRAAYSTHSICSRQAYTGIRRVFARARVLTESGTRPDYAVHTWICTWCVAGTMAAACAAPLFAGNLVGLMRASWQNQNKPPLAHRMRRAHGYLKQKSGSSHACS